MPSPIIEPPAKTVAATGANIRVTPAGLWPKRYDLMDGFRGIAVLMVVCFHCGFLPFGHWGVILFFVISGYCILASADSCQKQNLGAWGFAVRRFHRIYPPYLCAVVIFIITRLIKIGFSHENQLAQFSVLQFLQNATLTQWLTLLVHPNATGANLSLMVTAFWYLDYVVQFYAVVAIFLLLVVRTGRASLNTLIIALTGISFIWVLGMNNFHCGLFIEYWPVFALGCLVFMRLCQFKKRWARMTVDGFLVVLAAVCLIGRFHHPAPVWIFGHATEALMIGACFSLLLIALRGASEWIAGTIPGRVISFVGLISYSLYLIHQFNLKLASTVIGHILPTGAPRLVVVLGIVGFHIALATVFWFFCERPFLNERIPLSGFFKFVRRNSSLPSSAN